MNERERLERLNELRYPEEIATVKDAIEKLGLLQQTDIRIYTDHPYGWHGVVGANEHIYVFTSIWDELFVSEERCLGIRPNGTLIRGEHTTRDGEALEDYLEYEIQVHLYETGS